MMEGEFRGKWIAKDELHYGYLVGNNRGELMIFEPTEGAWNEYEVDPVTIGRFLGFQDKDGTDVYDTDILEYRRITYTDCSHKHIESISEPELIQVIHYHPLASIVKPITKGVAGFGWDRETGECLMFALNPAELRVVGNIHADGHLLAGKEG